MTVGIEVEQGKQAMYREWYRLYNNGRGLSIHEIADRYKGYKGQPYTANYIHMKIRMIRKQMEEKRLNKTIKRPDFKLVEL